MRKKTAIIVILCIFTLFSVCCFIYLQFGRTAIVNHVFTNRNSNGYEMSLTITANKIVIFDKENLAKQYVRQALDNDFKNVMFSYDILGYPNTLFVTVYTNSWTKNNCNPSFSFRYIQNSNGGYDIHFE